MDHYVETGSVLGKGTHLLEGYSIREMGYFGPGDLPRFNNEFFQIPHGKNEDLLFEDLKDRIREGDLPDDSSGTLALREFKQRVAAYISQPPDDMGRSWDV